MFALNFQRMQPLYTTRPDKYVTVQSLPSPRYIPALAKQVITIVILFALHDAQKPKNTARHGGLNILPFPSFTSPLWFGLTQARESCLRKNEWNRMAVKWHWRHNSSFHWNRSPSKNSTRESSNCDGGNGRRQQKSFFSDVYQTDTIDLLQYFIKNLDPQHYQRLYAVRLLVKMVLV